MTIFEEITANMGEAYKFTYDLYDGTTPYVLQEGEQLRLDAYKDDDLVYPAFSVSATTTLITGRYLFTINPTDIDKLNGYKLNWFKIVLKRANSEEETVERLSPFLKVM